MYQVLITPHAQRQLAEIPTRFRRQIEHKVELLAGNPYPAGCKALQGREFSGLHRIRSGDYRIIYQVRKSELVVVVVRIGDRRDIYRS